MHLDVHQLRTPSRCLPVRIFHAGPVPNVMPALGPSDVTCKQGNLRMMYRDSRRSCLDFQSPLIPSTACASLRRQAMCKRHKHGVKKFKLGRGEAMGFRLPVRQVPKIEQRRLHRLRMSVRAGIDGPGWRQGWELLRESREGRRLRSSRQSHLIPPRSTCRLRAWARHRCKGPEGSDNDYPLAPSCMIIRGLSRDPNCDSASLLPAW